MREKLKLLNKYLWIGGATTACYFFLFYLFWDLLKLPKFIAVSLAYGAFLLLNFSAHRRYTFLAHDGCAKRQSRRYLTMVCISYLLTLLIVYVVSEVLTFSAISGVISACILTTLLGFVVSKKWVYTRDL